MAYYRKGVRVVRVLLPWVDEHSFRYEIKTFPDIAHLSFFVLFTPPASGISPSHPVVTSHHTRPHYSLHKLQTRRRKQTRPLHRTLALDVPLKAFHARVTSIDHVVRCRSHIQSPRSRNTHMPYPNSQHCTQTFPAFSRCYSMLYPSGSTIHPTGISIRKYRRFDTTI